MPRFAPGDEVILTGWGVGERHWGGLAEQARVKAAWLLPRPAGLSLRQTMVIGTAGFTAMLAVLALEAQGVTPDRGEIVVTGAAGGVGSIAIPLLASRGFQVVASTGREELKGYLNELGAARGHRPAQLRGGLQGAARFGALGRRHRQRGWRHAREPAQGHAVSRRRRRLRPRRQRQRSTAPCSRSSCAASS